MTRRTTRLKALVEAPEILVMPGVFDPISAKLVQEAGFSAVQCTGLGIAATTLGVPDYSIISLSDMVDRTRAISASVDLPLLADADTGFGNAVNAYYTARAMEAAGAAGMNIEDQVMPKRCGHLSGKELIPAEEMVGKVAAARAALRDDDFVINARTDALAVEGMDAAIGRGNKYLEAGATMVYVDAVETLTQCRTLAAGLNGPLGVSMVEGGRTDPSITFDELQAASVARVSLSLSMLLAAVQGMRHVLSAIRNNRGIAGNADLVAGFDDIHDLVGMNQIRALEQRYLQSPRIR